MGNFFSDVWDTVGDAATVLFPATMGFLGSGGNPLGGLLGGLNGVGSLLGSAETRRANEANARMQYDFAQNGIRWKVADAAAAGINPLAALGASTYSPSASFVPEGAGETLRSMGQDAIRALNARKTADERRLEFLNVELAEQQVKGSVLDNQYKQSRLNQINSVGTSVPLPDWHTRIMGLDEAVDPEPWMGNGAGGNVDGLNRPKIPVNVSIDESLPLRSPKNQGEMASTIPEVQWGVTRDGGLYPTLPQKLSESMESMGPMEIDRWGSRNVPGIWEKLTRNIDPSKKPPRERWPAGAVDMVFRGSLFNTNRNKGAWYPVYKKRSN